MAFPEKLKKLRLEKGLTLQRLAKLVGVSASHLGRYERGSSDPTIKAIKNLAEALGVSTDELIFEDKEGVAAKTIVDRELLEQFSQISAFPPEDRQAVKLFLGSFILRKKFEGFLSSVTEKEVWEKKTRKVLKSLRAGAKGASEREILALADDALRTVRARQRG